MRSALRRTDEAIFNACRYGSSAQFTEVLCAFGNIERQLAIAERWRTEKRLQPLYGLSQQWVSVASDGSHEFEIALALAGIHDREGEAGDLRTNLEPVRIVSNKNGSTTVKWTEKSRSVVWNAADLAINLTAVLERRFTDNLRSSTNLPLSSFHSTALDSITAFLGKETNEQRIGELLWGLILLDHEKSFRKTVGRGLSTSSLLPRAYALLKLLFLPKPLVVESKADTTFVRFARKQEQGTNIRPEPRILWLLKAGHMDQACLLAAKRLHMSGLSPKNIPWQELYGVDTNMLEAGLLIPVQQNCISELANLVLRPEPLSQDSIA